MYNLIYDICNTNINSNTNSITKVNKFEIFGGATIIGSSGYTTSSATSSLASSGTINLSDMRGNQQIAEALDRVLKDIRVVPLNITLVKI